MQTGTVSGAARNLHVSQPNVTRILAHTEQQLGLIIRTGERAFSSTISQSATARSREGVSAIGAIFAL